MTFLIQVKHFCQDVTWLGKTTAFFAASKTAFGWPQTTHGMRINAAEKAAMPEGIWRCLSYENKFRYTGMACDIVAPEKKFPTIRISILTICAASTRLVPRDTVGFAYMLLSAAGVAFLPTTAKPARVQ